MQANKGAEFFAAKKEIVVSIQWRCDGCNKLLKAGEASAGKKVRCPGCGEILVVPENAAPVAAAAQPKAKPAAEEPAKPVAKPVAPPAPPAAKPPAPPSAAPAADPDSIDLESLDSGSLSLGSLPDGDLPDEPETPTLLVAGRKAGAEAVAADGWKGRLKEKKNLLIAVGVVVLILAGAGFTGHLGLAIGLGLLLGIPALVIAGFWKVFTKAAQPGWAAIVPIYNLVILVKIAGKPVWWVVLCLVPIVSIVILLLVSIAVAKKFGKGAGFAVGLLLLPMVFYPILGFGSAEYQGE